MTDDQPAALRFTGAARLAGVVGSPVRHSLSPLIHNAWIGAAGMDAVYAPFSPPAERFAAFVQAHRGGEVAGFNITVPFKEAALAVADHADDAAFAAGAANLLLYRPDGTIEARNTDGLGLLQAFAEQAPGWRANTGPVVVLGAGGAARGAAAAITAAGGQVMVANRTASRAVALAASFARARAIDLADLAAAMRDTGTLINASAAGLDAAGSFEAPLACLPSTAVVMDMIYTPLETALLREARALGLRTVDGLAMLIGQARPSFQALFGVAPPEIDVRGLALAALQARG